MYLKMTCEAQLPPQRNLALWEQVNSDKLVEGCVCGGGQGTEIELAHICYINQVLCVN